ncbi:MAG: hypothetical protein EOM66_04640 [Clostridia bacterium]|nr:UvrD-helicase domain-containing protein [Candidatus Pelethousia sp.]NCB30678.1 hypothetical protein [Clostridia bacterium]
MEWTIEQRRAIETPGNLLVSAAAGSGKTAVLTERIARLVAEGCPLNRFLVVTFTRAAAAEMKKRIGARLAQLAQEARGDEEASRLCAAAAGVGQASISTIDAFCAHILRRHFHAAGLDPSFRAADEAQAEVLRQEVWDDILEEGYAEDNLQELIAVFGSEETLLESAARLYDFLCAQPQMEGWLGEALAAYDMDEAALAASPQMAAFLHTAQRSLGARIDALASLREEFADAFPGVAQILDGELVQLRALLLPHTYAGFWDQLQSLSFGRLTWPRGTESAVKAPVVDARDAVKKEIAKVSSAFSLPIREHVDRLRSYKPHLERLQALMLAFHREYGRRKQDAGLVDYADMEHMALALLQRPAIAAEYRNRFLHVFVDEYQDINPVQACILQALSRPDNLFLVGDVKQSIYGFRMADPGLFLEKYAAFGHGRGGTRIDLNANFRSGGGIIRAVNGLFSRVMCAEAGGIEYDEAAALRQGRPELSGETELHILRQQILFAEEEEAAGEDDALELLQAAETEARFAARRIRELVGGDASAPDNAGLHYRDIVILHSAPKRIAELWVQTLAREGIPAYAELTGGYFEAIEVQVLLNLLRLIDNRRQDIALLSVLRSPIGDISTEELIELRAGRQGESCYDSLLAAASYDTPLGKKAAAFLASLSRWQEKARLLGLPQLIGLVTEETGYGRFVRALPGGAARKGNLDALIESAEAWSQNGHGLSGFLRFMDRVRDTGRMGAAQVGGADVVRMLSIHKSKGLEFPVVFLAGLNKQFNQADKRSVLVMDAALGLGFKPVVHNTRQSSLFHAAISGRIWERTVAEQMRVLYVAMTRAQKRLILLAAMPKPEATIGRALFPLSPARSLQALCFGNWVLPAVLAGPEGNCLRSLLNLPPAPPGQMHTDICCFFHAGVEPGGSETALPLEAYRSFMQAARQSPCPDMEARLGWAYPYAADAGLPGKVSVSTLIGNLPTLPRSPLFLKETRPLTTVERGVAVHTLMEHIPLRSHTTASVHAAMADLESRGLLSALQRQSIYAPAIAAFFQSNLGKRLCASPRVERELPFSCRVPARDLGLGNSDETVLLQGVADCCFMEDGAWVLVDYKTDYAEEGDGDMAALRHVPQLALYERALWELTGLPVKERYIALLRSGECVRV